MFKAKMVEAKLRYSEDDFEGAIQCYEELRNEDQQRFNRCCKYNYLWSLYKSRIYTKYAFLDSNIDQTMEAVDHIIMYLDSSEILFQITVMSVIRYLEKKNEYDSKELNNWLDKLEPDVLTNESRTYVTDDGKQITYEGNKEKWYALKSKVCLELELYDDCIEVSNKALSVLVEFTHNNDVWFKWRLANSFYKKGDLITGLELFIEVTSKKKDWFVYAEIADIYSKMENEEEALNNYITALYKSGKDEYKVKLFNKMANFIRKTDEASAMQLEDYSVKIRLKNSWHMDENLTRYYNQNKERIDNIEINKIKNNVDQIVDRYNIKMKKSYEGIVVKLFANGKSGFINSGGDSFYFKHNVMKSRHTIMIGDHVRFFIEKSYDYKKKQDSNIAIIL
ncbi:hypothetical protein [Fusibacter sp. 3D3]|uniref:DUF7017 domain-containing protein n=1 Tax=Fusibacter sp. 3D3 TaxID=1048380 RepID=UPI00085868E7|nr:hypothetical protein [Fusibacter sp. 3D3]GAU78636.1 hypothetical protein F3D3_3271 [Fusibacter sp. 3D3]